MSADADVVIGAGDFASLHEGLEETVDALAGIEKPTVLVPGNNETVDALRAAAAGWGAATVLHGEGTTIWGVEFFGLGAGIPVTPWDWSFDLDDEAAAAMLAGCPEEAILALHSPPKGHCASGGGGAAPPPPPAAEGPRRRRRRRRELRPPGVLGGDGGKAPPPRRLRPHPRVV